MSIKTNFEQKNGVFGLDVLPQQQFGPPDCFTAQNCGLDAKRFCKQIVSPLPKKISVAGRLVFFLYGLSEEAHRWCVSNRYVSPIHGVGMECVCISLNE